jgi:hypothetical protein
MNSAYGKTCLKPIDSNIQIIKDKDFDKFMNNNYNYLIYATPMPGTKKIIVKCIETINMHFNRCHIGCEILSMSKVIMNEVMTTAEDNDIDIYYQDTDSMHIKNDDIKKLDEIFKEKYGRELIGNQMGQFHSDFDFKSDEEIVAVESCFLGKKSYIDKVRLVNNDVVSYGYHIRMKGIPRDIVLKTAEKEFNNDPMALYNYLYEGNKVNFNLLDGRVKFEGQKNYEMKSALEYTRELSF